MGRGAGTQIRAEGGAAGTRASPGLEAPQLPRDPRPQPPLPGLAQAAAVGRTGRGPLRNSRMCLCGGTTSTSREFLPKNHLVPI